LTSTGRPSVTGTAKVGKTLKAKLPTGKSAIKWSQAGVKIGYEWRVDGQVRSTKTRYKLQANDAGLPVVFAVVANASGYQTGYAKATGKTVAKLTSSTKLRIGKIRPAIAGTATVKVKAAGLRPTGTVTLILRGKTVARAELVNAMNGTVKLTLPVLATGKSSIEARYSGSVQTKPSKAKVSVQVKQ